MTITAVGRLEQWTDVALDDGVNAIDLVLRQDGDDADEARQDRIHATLHFGRDPAAQHQRDLTLAGLQAGCLYELHAHRFLTPDRDAGLHLIGVRNLRPLSASAPTSATGSQGSTT